MNNKEIRKILDALGDFSAEIDHKELEAITGGASRYDQNTNNTLSTNKNPTGKYAKVDRFYDRQKKN